MIRSPRDVFRAGMTEQWKSLAESVEFEFACHSALLQMQVELPETPNPQCLDPHSQLVGARKVLDILATLHQKLEAPPKPKEPSLNWEAGV